MEIKEVWNKDDMKLYLEEFYKLYVNRPIKNNDGGMKSPHMFPAWYIIKKLQPEYIIESGVWKGLGTWFFEQASPKSKIISLDPNPIYRVYTSPKVMYMTNDFSTIDFSKIVDIDNTFVFFDDHQNALDRLDQSIKHGFKKMVFEDNYPFDQGDCYSIKKVLSGKNFCIDNAGNRQYFEANLNDKKFVEDVIDIYQEMPPLHKEVYTRWKNFWADYDTPDQILSKEELVNYPEFNGELLDYTWICYLELKK